MANEKKIDHIEVGGVSYLVDDSQAVKKSDMMSLSEINADTSTDAILAAKVPSAKVIKEMQSNFQAGVDTVYNGCKTYGSTPTASTPSAIVTAIEKIYNDRYNAAKVGTATAAHVLTGSTFTSSKVDPGTQGSMKNLTASATITHDSGNGTKVILGDACYISKNSDNVDRLEIRYNSDPGYITGNTLFALPYNTVATTIGLTAEKIVKGNTILGVDGTDKGYSVGKTEGKTEGVNATKVGTAGAAQVLTGYTFTNSSGVGLSGNMKDSTVSTTINPGGSYTIPAGYHNGSGKVTANANQNSGTYTYASGSTGGTVDMGANNTYRYVNASNVYAKGKSDGVGYYKIIGGKGTASVPDGYIAVGGRSDPPSKGFGEGQSITGTDPETNETLWDGSYFLYSPGPDGTGGSVSSVYRHDKQSFTAFCVKNCVAG